MENIDVDEGTWLDSDMPRQRNMCRQARAELDPAGNNRSLHNNFFNKNLQILPRDAPPSSRSLRNLY
ncbi:hypothetical protein CEP52_015308 [Fusarium oligoseptatum]|uniref:Uncharacterized protein n=2 Tax=Fusarium solani species complex TaxID=232080 RepID=A0A428SEB6_9HYPO|nr:hypothetical protein CEP51_002230 [Fusarium floridanum]RSL88123.1 hypothetical protein CEP52_015308 [Fusarium oligoseptatum]